ncbi:MAG: UDP-N-acetylmuramate dehydrogenase [Gammaproteobacteria bacterium]
MVIESVLSDQDLSTRHTLASSNRAVQGVSIQRVRDVLEWCADTSHCAQHSPIWVLGQGSNVVFGADFPGTLLLSAIKGVTRVSTESDGDTEVWRVAAGELWRDWVEQSVDAGLSGLENLALIPGTVGAAPVQNIGAYGSDLSQVCVGVHAVDIRTGSARYFTQQACRFAYRDSIFKHPDDANRWFITAVDFRLSRRFHPVLSYPALQKACAAPRSARDVFDAVCAIRSQKLPDPAVLPNAGSFFKNPLILRSEAECLRQKLPEIPIFVLSNADAWGVAERESGEQVQRVKVSAGYLIEQAGLKGYRRGNVGVYAHHALVLVRHAPGPGAEIVALSTEIQQRVLDQFGVRLDIEPVVWRGG